MSKRIIAIDCDDVIVSSIPAILAYYNHKYDTNIQPADFYSYDLDVWKVKTDEEAVERVHAYLNTEEYQTLPPFEDAIRVTTELAKRYELHMVTARQDMLAEATKQMLLDFFPDVFSSIEFTNHFTANARTKAQVCQEIGADLLIDDHLHHAEVAANCGVDVLLFGEYPWNQTSDPLPPGITRVRDWDEVAERLLDEPSKD